MWGALRYRLHQPHSQFFSFFSSSTKVFKIIVPNLAADVKRWTSEHVKQFIKANKDQYQFRDEVLRIFDEEEYNGASLLELDVDELCDAGLRRKPSQSVVDLVDALKKERGPVELGLLSEFDLLKLRPPPLRYIKGKTTTSTTISTYAITPRSVVPWDGFIDNVNNTTWGDTPEYFHPTFIRFKKVSNEATVRAAFEVNVLLPLAAVLGRESFARPSSSLAVQGQPDFIQTGSDQVLRFAIEVKSKWALSADDLVAAYTQKLATLSKDAQSLPAIYYQLAQIFGYLSYNHLRFGVLTTYDKTWFLSRPPEDPGQLRISPVVQSRNRKPTLFQCLSYLTSLARRKHRCDSAPPLLPPSDTKRGGPYDSDGSKRRVGNRKTRGRPPKSAGEHSTLIQRSGMIIGPSHPSNGEDEHTLLNFFDWGSFKVLDVLGEGRAGTVFKAILHGETVALKLCDLWQHPEYKQELLNEVKVYHVLEDLQGDCIPRLKGAGYTAGGLFAIATDIVGRSLEDAESLSDEERRVIKTALSRVHLHGIVHNDIRRDNILIRRDAHRFYAFIIDFAFSKQGCQRHFQEESKLLARLLR